MRYRLLETAPPIRTGKNSANRRSRRREGPHRDYYTAMAVLLEAPAQRGQEQCLERAESEIDNLARPRSPGAAKARYELALQLASALYPAVARAGPPAGSGWPGSRPPSRTRPHPSQRWHPAVRARRWPTRPCSTRWWARPAALIMPKKPD